MVPHPIGGISEDRIYPKAAAAVEELHRAFTAPLTSSNGAGGAEATELGTSAELVDLPADPQELRKELSSRNWSDALPVIPPTAERVAAMMEYTDRDPLELIGVIAPRQGEATVEAIAVQAVMAGCEPKFFPVLLAAVEGISRPEFNIGGVNATTHPCAVMVMLNGPLAKEIGAHSGMGLFGPTFDANATIGRAMRLVLLNIGGAIPGSGDRATMGTSAKYGFCFAENEDASPWEPFHTTRGFDAQDSTVTVMAAESPHNMEDHGSNTGFGIIQLVNGCLSQAGSNNILARGDLIVALTKEHADLIHEAGWDRKKMREYWFEHARFPCSEVSKEFLEHINERIDPDKPTFLEDGHFTIADGAESIHIIVAGGPGKHSMWIPSFGNMSFPQTVAIADRSGNKVRSVEELRRS